MFEDCRLFVSGVGVDDLGRIVASVLGANFDGKWATSDEFLASIEVNEDAAATADRLDFTAWPVTAWIETTEPPDRQMEARLVSAVAEILESVWAAGHQAVAACDFEELLPRRGGADSLGS